MSLRISDNLRTCTGPPHHTQKCMHFLLVYLAPVVVFFVSGPCVMWHLYWPDRRDKQKQTATQLSRRSVVRDGGLRPRKPGVSKKTQSLLLSSAVNVWARIHELADFKTAGFEKAWSLRIRPLVWVLTKFDFLSEKLVLLLLFTKCHYVFLHTTVTHFFNGCCLVGEWTIGLYRKDVF